MANKYDEVMAQFGGFTDSPVATSAQLDDIEGRLGYLLPADYREFVRDYGGYTFYGIVVYPVELDGYSGYKTVFHFYGASIRETDIAEGHRRELSSDTEIGLYTGMSEVNGRTFNPDEEEYGWPAELMSIACDKGGNQICLALFGLRPGAIFFWINAPGEGDDNVYLVADSFDEFMHLLRESR